MQLFGLSISSTSCGKHRKLVGVEIDPLRLSLTSGAPLPIGDFVTVSTGWLRVNEKTILCLVRKGARDYEMKFVPHVALDEPGIATRKPLITLLDHFAGFAKAVIALFDE